MKEYIAGHLKGDLIETLLFFNHEGEEDTPTQRFSAYRSGKKGVVAVMVDIKTGEVERYKYFGTTRMYKYFFGMCALKAASISNCFWRSNLFMELFDSMDDMDCVRTKSK